MLTSEWIPGIGWTTEDASFASYGDPLASSAGWWNLMQRPRYQDVVTAPDLTTALGAIGRSGYATDPNYGAKLSRLQPKTPEQQSFWNSRISELEGLGAPPHLAELGARQSALETGWGRSAPGNNYYGIKAPAQMQVAQAGRSDVPQGIMSAVPSPQFLEAAMSGQQMQQGAPAPTGGQPPAQTGFGDRLGQVMQNPLFLMGASILANNTGNYGAAAPAIGRGMQQGAALYSGGQEEMAQQQLRQMQMDFARRRMAQEEQDARYVDEWVSRLRPDQQRLARAIGLSKYVEMMRGSEPPTAYKEFLLGEQNPEFRQYQEDLKRAGAQNVNVNTDSLGLKPKDRFEMERQLGADYRDMNKSSDAVLMAAGRWDAAKKASGGVSDMAAITSFAKILDPESVVRDTEFNNAISTVSTVDRFKMMIDRALTGAMLTPEQRDEMGKVVDALRETARQKQLSNYATARERANTYQLDPGRVTGIAGGWQLMGYKSEGDVIRDAREALKVNPAARDTIIQRLKGMGIAAEALN